MLVQTNGMTTQNQPAVAGKAIMASMRMVETKKSGSLDMAAPDSTAHATHEPRPAFAPP